MKISLNLNSYENPLLKRVLPFALELGIYAVELWGCCLEESRGNVHKYSYDNKDLSGAADMLDSHGIAVSALTFGFGLSKELAHDPLYFSEEFCKVIRLAKLIGAPCVIHHMCGISDLPEPRFDILRPYWERPIECAEKNGITLALENEMSDASYSPLNVQKILEFFNSNFFTANFDIGNFYFAGSEPYPYGYDLLHKKIGNVHLKGYRVYNPNTCRYKDMTCGFPADRLVGSPYMYRCGAEFSGCNSYGFLSALRNDGYNGYIALEHHGSDRSLNDTFSATMKWLSECSFI